MQEQTLEAQRAHLAVKFPVPVFVIAGNRVFHVGGMYPRLVGASGQQFDFHESRGSIPAFGREDTLCFFALFGYFHFAPAARARKRSP